MTQYRVYMRAFASISRRINTQTDASLASHLAKEDPAARKDTPMLPLCAVVAHASNSNHHNIIRPAQKLCLARDARRHSTVHRYGRQQDNVLLRVHCWLVSLSVSVLRCMPTPSG
jgi:hypothetical protein